MCDYSDKPSQTFHQVLEASVTVISSFCSSVVDYEIYLETTHYSMC